MIYCAVYTLLLSEDQNLLNSFLLFSETDALFANLETKTKQIQNRFKKIQSSVKNPQHFGDIREDVLYLENSWHREFSALMRFQDRFGVDFGNKNKITDTHVKAVLTMARGYIGKGIVR